MSESYAFYSSVAYMVRETSVFLYHSNVNISRTLPAYDVADCTEYNDTVSAEGSNDDRNFLGPGGVARGVWRGDVEVMSVGVNYFDDLNS